MLAVTAGFQILIVEALGVIFKTTRLNFQEWILCVSLGAVSLLVGMLNNNKVSNFLVFDSNLLFLMTRIGFFLNMIPVPADRQFYDDESIVEEEEDEERMERIAQFRASRGLPVDKEGEEGESEGKGKEEKK